MMSLNDVKDSLNLKDLNLKQVSEQTDWDINLRTTGLPSGFENATEGRRQITVKVVGFDDWQQSPTENSFLIPLNLIAMSAIDGKRVCYYQSRHESQESSILMAKVSAKITLSDDQKTPVENPYMLMEFSVTPADQSDQLQGNREVFDGTQKSTFVRTDAGENSNGGHDIPISDMNRELQPGDRVYTAA